MGDTIFKIDIIHWESYHWFTFIIDYLIPIVGCLAIVCGGIWAVYQYFVDKNRDFHSKILNNVYAPLFETLVQAEYQRLLYRETATNRKEKKRYAVKAMPFFRCNSLVAGSQDHSFEKKVLTMANDPQRLEYAPRDLVVLLKAYSVIQNTDMRDIKKYKVKIQKKIRRHVIVGYKVYRHKLGLRDAMFGRSVFSIGGWIVIRLIR